jgi:hypothetical protein
MIIGRRSPKSLVRRPSRAANRSPSSQIRAQFVPNTLDGSHPSYHLRSDVLDAAAAMASDQRSDICVVRLESSLTDAETVLRMMDGPHARVMGLLVLTSERILFRSRRRTAPNFRVQ